MLSRFDSLEIDSVSALLRASLLQVFRYTNQRDSIISSCRDIRYCALLERLVVDMEDLNEFLQTLSPNHGDAEMFKLESYEFELHRRFIQLRWMFPIEDKGNVKAEPSNLIQDQDVCVVVLLMVGEEDLD